MLHCGMVHHLAVSECEHYVPFHREGDAARAEGDAKVEEARDASAQAAQVMALRTASTCAICAAVPLGHAPQTVMHATHVVHPQ